MILIGIDVGTTGCKVAAYHERGRELAKSYCEYALLVTAQAVELDPDRVFNSVLHCIKDVAKQIVTRKVRAISVSAMTDTVTPIGPDGSALTPSLVSFDPRGVEEAEILETQFGKEALFNLTGMPVHASHTLSKLFWISRNQPEITNNAWKFLCFEEYILWRLGAEPISSYSTASKTMAFSIKGKAWDEGLLSFCGLSAKQFPQTVASGKRIGTLSSNLASAFCFPDDVALVSGGFDQACCALAHGVIHPGEVLDTTGTNEIIFFTVDQVDSQAFLNNELTISEHVVPGVNSSYATVLNAGGAFRWCRDTFFRDFVAEGRISIYDEMTAGMKEEPGRMVFLPFLTGVGTPEFDASVYGSFLGIGLDATPFSFAQAILEGICFEMRNILDIVRKLMGQDNKRLMVTGGATKSPYWLQLKSNIINCPLLIAENMEAGACGAAMLAGIGCGAFANAQEAYAAFSSSLIHREIHPQPHVVPMYDAAYQRYCQLRTMAIQHRLDPLVAG
jgi:xylulokinase